MKKKFIMFLMTVMLSFSAICSASYGTDLDAEAKAVDQFFAGTDYKKAAAVMDADLAKNLTADKYKEMFASMEKELGKLVQKDLRVYHVFPEGHVLRYAAKFEKAPQIVIDAVFKNVGGKMLMMNFNVFDPNAQAPADNKAEKK